MKERNKQTEFLTEPVYFDHHFIDRITFDLVHINQGWDDERHDYAYSNRSSYTAEDIVELVEQFKFISIDWLLGINKEKIKIKGLLHHRYNWQTSDENGDIVRVIMDLPLKSTGEGIIVTVFKTRSRYEKEE